MGTKVALVKFQHSDKALIKGKVGHSRTGACKSQGRCFSPQQHTEDEVVPFINIDKVSPEERRRLLPAHFGQSKAKTAFGLLSEVKREILADAGGYDQTEIARPRRGLKKETACGTAFCRAGWVAMLRGRASLWQSTFADQLVVANFLSHPHDTEPVWTWARRLLGLTHEQAEELFGGSAVDGDPGTTRHARLGARGIEEFQKKYARQLRATKVTA